MKIKRAMVATFVANDSRVARTFADQLTEQDEHRFEAWEIVTDNFELYWYAECEADVEDLPSAIEMLKNISADELAMQGIFELEVNEDAEVLEG